MHTLFFSDPTAPIERLQRRVQMQKNALAQAELDLRRAQAREGIEPLDEPEPSSFNNETAPSSLANAIVNAGRRARGLEPLDEDDEPSFRPTGAPTGLAARMMADDERRRRGLGPAEPSSAVKPLVRATAQMIIDAARKARGEK